MKNNSTISIILACIVGALSLVIPPSAWSKDFRSPRITDTVKSYKIAAAESSVDFELIHHIGFTTGVIAIKDGTIETEGRRSTKLKKVDLTLDVKTATTYNPERDQVALSKEFFDAATYPEIKLSSLEVSEKTVTLEVTIKGIKKKVAFAYVMGEEAGSKALVYLTAKLNKKDFGLAYNVPDETGQPLLGDDLHVVLRLVGIE